MISYKCSKCGAILESPKSMAGQEDKCPLCGHVCALPESKGRMPLIMGICGGGGAVVVLVVAIVWLWPHGNESAGPPGEQLSRAPLAADPKPKVQPKPKPKLHPKVEYLEEKQVGLGYYAWILIEPLARPELEKLGQRLLSRMRRFRCDHLKVWVCYSRRDYAVGSSAVWMNATSHDDYQIRMVGPVPESTTPQGFLEAYDKWQPMMSLKSGKGPIRCEYKPEDDSLIYHDHLMGVWHNPLHMPAVILQVGRTYLPPNISHPCWAAIPGLKRVVVHHYQGEDPKPVVTLSFGRNAFENAKRLAKPLYEKEAVLEDMHHDAWKRHRAKVMSDREYRASCDQIARQIYKLYEDLWVEVSPGVRIEVHRKMPPAPQDFYRKHFYGGK